MRDEERFALIAKIARNAQEYYSESLDALCVSLDVIEMIATDWGEEQLRNGCALRPVPESEKT